MNSGAPEGLTVPAPQVALILTPRYNHNLFEGGVQHQ